MKTFVKVCGVRTQEHIDWAVELGYDAIGLMTVPKSPRYVEPDQARELAEYARGQIATFAVGLTAEQVTEIQDTVDVVQLYEQSSLSPLALASDSHPENAEELAYWFYDVSHGSGTFQPIPEWVQQVPTRVVLSGGLNPDNVADVVRTHNPYGIDVSSGVEVTRGTKDYEKMKAFIQQIRSAEED